MLFNIDDLNSRGKLVKEAFLSSEIIKYISEAVCADLNESIGKLKDGTSIHYGQENKWSLHDLIVYCLAQSGPADLFISTWSIKEYPARLLSNMVMDGSIRSLHCLLDYRIETTSPDAYQLINNVAKEIGLRRVHAKLSVIENEQWGITIVGSQNLTTNTRAEAGVITVNKQLATFRKQWILEKISNNELDTGTITDD